MERELDIGAFAFALARIAAACWLLERMHRPWTGFDERVDVWLLWLERLVLYVAPLTGGVFGDALRELRDGGDRYGVRGVIYAVSLTVLLGQISLAAVSFGDGVSILSIGWLGFLTGLDVGLNVGPLIWREREHVEDDPDDEDGGYWR